MYVSITRKQIHSTCIYNYRQHVGTLREYVCYAGRLKGSMYLVNGRLVVRIAAKTQQIRGWTSEMLPIACKQKGSGGATWGPIPFGGEGGDLAGGRRDLIQIRLIRLIRIGLDGMVQIRVDQSRLGQSRLDQMTVDKILSNKIRQIDNQYCIVLGQTRLDQIEIRSNTTR